MKFETVWILVGFLGQALFFMRFLVQWLASEKKKASVIPDAFWYFSITGGIVLLAYAVYRKDPVFIAGQGCGILIYARNLYFIHLRRKSQ
ncbi:MAG: lipid-A-disaccharide synthase N-terminal domain-containing protein [Candidatus Omnitrophica bacterium]|nr:lipid-A-disaccharide synthase N-terminal domain-containing protein [Candidatus Omnitrophota bacterium]